MAIKLAVNEHSPQSFKYEHRLYLYLLLTYNY